MIYPIVIYGNPVLRKKAEPISADYPALNTLIDDMFKTLTKSGGVGLAAPQIGLSIQLFILDLSVMAEDEPQYATFKKVFINPEIIEFSSETETAEEKENNAMTKVMKIEGMMCQHCVAHVTKALQEIEGVTGVDVNLKKKTAIVELSNEISNEIFIDKITEAGYEVKKIS